jgi:hypothetical protein
MKLYSPDLILKRNSLFLLGAVLLTGLLSNCSKDHENYTLTKKGNLVVNNDQAELNSRVKLTNKIMLVEPIETSNTKSLKETPRVDLTKNYVFTLKAEVDPPVFEGNTLQATHVKIYDQYAFVTYNTKGDKYLGGVDIFDVSNIEKPTIIRHLLFPNADVSSVDYYNNKLYIVGAIDLENDTLYKYLEHPSVLEVISLNSHYDVDKVDTVIGLGTYVGTDVRVTSDLICTTSGTNGYLKVFNHSYNNIFSKSLKDARAIETNSSKMFVLDADPAQIIRYNQSDASEDESYAVWDQPLQSEAKSELAVSDKYIFAALNYGGMKMLNTNGTLKQWVPKPVTPEGKLDENYVTNSVSLNNDLVLFANGEAGLYLGGLIESRNDSLAILGRIRFSDGQSVNYVESHDNVIFVATGTGGLKILSVGIDDGVPPDIIITKPCATLYDHIIQLFPENVNNYNRYPALFNSTTPKIIKLKKESEVYITFIYEGAGWKNSFGYYTYNESDPPTSVDKLDKHILFPNVSMVDEGGGLQTGNMLQVGTGKFPAGTVIGFYLISQGWNDGLVTDGLYTNYTDSQFNLGGYQQHTLFKEKTCGDVVMIFEDIAVDQPLSYTDNDYNDIMFTVSDSSNPDKAIENFDLTGVPEF